MGRLTARRVATPHRHVIARRTGSLYPDEWVIVGGHYDSRQQNINDPSQSPGAEDNASGCAGVVEAARVFSQFPPQRTMIFVCFAGEEQGLYGGNAYAQALQTSGDLAKVDLAVIMDMIGYSGDADLDVRVCGAQPGVAHTIRGHIHEVTPRTLVCLKPQSAE